MKGIGGGAGGVVRQQRLTEVCLVVMNAIGKGSYGAGGSPTKVASKGCLLMFILSIMSLILGVV